MLDKNRLKVNYFTFIDLKSQSLFEERVLMKERKGDIKWVIN